MVSDYSIVSKLFLVRSSWFFEEFKRVQRRRLGPAAEAFLSARTTRDPHSGYEAYTVGEVPIANRS
jgi:hypothetical protein